MLGEKKNVIEVMWVGCLEVKEEGKTSVRVMSEIDTFTPNDETVDYLLNQNQNYYLKREK